MKELKFELCDYEVVKCKCKDFSKGKLMVDTTGGSTTIFCEEIPYCKNACSECEIVKKRI